MPARILRLLSKGSCPADMGTTSLAAPMTAEVAPRSSSHLPGSACSRPLTPWSSLPRGSQSPSSGFRSPGRCGRLFPVLTCEHSQSEGYIPGPAQAPTPASQTGPAHPLPGVHICLCLGSGSLKCFITPIQSCSLFKALTSVSLAVSWESPLLESMNPKSRAGKNEQCRVTC